MSFKEDLPQFVENIKTKKDQIDTEEATKTSLIMPFFQMLGYDIFNPAEFVPEYTADVGTKKGEKIDYAIVIDDKPLILIECKPCTENLDKFTSQLFRYFGTTLDAKFAILTNGIEYRFFTDLDNENRMDETPFMTIDLLNLKDREIAELNKFVKDSIDVDGIISTAENLKYSLLIKQWFGKQLEGPTTDFVRMILSDIYSGTKSQKVIDKFTPLIKKALQQYVADEMNSKIKNALNKGIDIETSVPDDDEEPHDKITTTIDELEGYGIVKAILVKSVDADRIAYRDTESYFGVLLDDNNRKWICRLCLSGGRKHILVSDEDKNPVRYELDSINDIYKYAEQIESACAKYL